MVPERHCGLRGFDSSFAALVWFDVSHPCSESGNLQVAKNQRKVNRANHGKRPASSKARRAKRKKIGV
jgi:hypothetical protein